MKPKRSSIPPTPNDDGGYLPMPPIRAAHISPTERYEYRERQRLHAERFPDYEAGFRRASVTTAARACAILGRHAASLSEVEQQALTAMLDATIQAGEDGRLLTANLMFDVVAAGWSDHYLAAIKRGPARVSYEMKRETLTAAWRDLRRNAIDFGKLLLLARRGCGLYDVKRGTDGRDKIVLCPKKPATRGAELERRRAAFLAIVAEDTANGGAYRRRSAAGRLRIVGQVADDEPLLLDAPEQDDATADEGWFTQEIVAEWAYNVATPGPRSSGVIDLLEAARLYLDPKAVTDEHERLEAQAGEVNAHLWDAFRFDVDACPSAKHKPRKGPRVSLRDVYVAKFAKMHRVPRQTLTDLVKKYNRCAGWAQQLEPVAEQLKRMGAVDGELKIRSKFAKLINRRYQSRDFWLTEVSGSQEVTEFVNLGPDPSAPDDVPETDVEIEQTTVQRGRFFRIGAFAPAEDRFRELRAREHTWPESDLDDPRLYDRQSLVGVDVSSSQIQILAVLCGDRALEDRLREHSFHREIAAPRAWTRHNDPEDDFKIPGYDSVSDPRLVASLKDAVLTSIYGSNPHAIADKQKEDVDDEFGPGLGKPHNVRLFLDDAELGLTKIKKKFEAVCHEIAKRACEADAYAGLSFTDPFDGATARWNPVKWTLKKAAGANNVRIWAKVPSGKQNAADEYPVWGAKLKRMVMPCLIHTLDAMFAGFVIEELSRHGVPAISVHDAWYVATDATQHLDAAVQAAGEPWLRRLDDVYADLERLLGDSPRRAWVQQLRRQCARRVENGDWPKFKVDPVALIRE